MKPFLFATALLLGLVPLGLAQQGSKPNVQPATRATVTAVDPAMAYGPGRVTIHGTNLGLIEEVRVAGRTVPILHNDGRELVIEPGQQDPGYALLELVQPDRLIRDKVEFLPALSARWRGNRIQVELHPGEPGWYVLNYSYKRLRTPLVTEGIFYADCLDMTSARCGILASGFFASGERLLFPWVPVPRGVEGPGELGATIPMHIQALCMLEGELCYSNVLTLQPTL